MIIEVLIDAFVSNKKTLVLVQIIITSIGFGIILIMFCCKYFPKMKKED